MFNANVSSKKRAIYMYVYNTKDIYRKNRKKKKNIQSGPENSILIKKRVQVQISFSSIGRIIISFYGNVWWGVNDLHDV